MGLFGLFGKKDVKEELGKAMPFAITSGFTPFHLRANTRSTSTLSIKLKNLTGESVMASVVIEVPDKLSMDETGFARQKEVRLGMLAPNDEKGLGVDIYGNTSTDSGEYTIGINAFVHYRDYAHVLNGAKKRVLLRVV